MQLDSSVESILLEPAIPNELASNVVIAEVLYDPSGVDTNFEWVVLYNPTDTAISLEGWEIQAGGTTFRTPGEGTAPGNWQIIPAGQAIQPHSYYLIAETAMGALIAADHVADEMAIQNGGTRTDGVRIIDGPHTGPFNVIDTLLYDSPNTSGLPDNTGAPGTSFAPDVSSGRSLKRKSSPVGYITGEGNGFQTNQSGDDFISNATPTPKNSASPTEQFITSNYQPTFINTSKRGPSTSLGFWQIGSEEQHGLTHAPVFKMVFQDISNLPLDTPAITGIKIWGVGNTNDDAPTFPVTYLLANPKLDIYLNKFEFVDAAGDAVAPTVDFMITGYKKKTFPITF